MSAQSITTDTTIPIVMSSSVDKPSTEIDELDKLLSEIESLSIDDKKDELSELCIDNYKDEYKSYPDDIIKFAEDNKITLPKLNTLRGQALALMAQPEVRGKKYISRETAVQFFKNINRKTNDAIQQFNKATGLKRINKKGVYCLVYPYECDKVDIDKRKGVSISGDKDAQINSIKEFYRQKIVDVPNEEWQIGHLDPTIGDASENNLAYQPPIQGKYRNRFKWDNMFMKMWPTADELTPKLDKYYTEEEQKKLYEALKKKFEK
jgi:hypothetical protein